MNYLYEKLRADYNNQPYEISLETLAQCNAACNFCPYPTLERIGTEMPDTLIDKLIGEMSSFQIPFFFSPFKVNEPFLDKRLLRICEFFSKTCPMGELRLFTNGSPLTLEKIKRVAELPRVEHLWVSLNSTDPEEYRRIMQLDFNITAQKLDMLHNTKKVGIFTHDVVLSHIHSDATASRKFYGDCIQRWPLFRVTSIKRDSWLGDIDAPDVYIPDTPCVRWWELSIMANGVVSHCCMDGQGKFPIGDVNKHSLLEIYNSEYWKRRRERLLSRKEMHPCNTCSY